MEESQDGNSDWARNLEAGADAKAWMCAAYWLAFSGLFSLLSYKAQDD